MFNIALAAVPVLTILGIVLAAFLPWPMTPLALLPFAFAAILGLDLWWNRRDWLGALVVAVALILVAPAALAADTTVPIGAILGDLRPYLETAAGLVITWAIGLAGLGIYRVTGVNLDDRMRAMLHNALANGVRVGLDSAQERLGGAVIDVRSPAIAAAVRYVRQYSPKAIAHFGLSQTALEEMARAHLSRILPSPTRPSSLAK